MSDTMIRPRERRSESERHAAAWVCALLALDGPALGGVWLQGVGGGAAAAAWVDELQAVPRRARRLPLNIGDDRLLGGVDLAATLASGRAVLAPGLLAECDGALIWLPMAERLTSARAAQLAAVLDRQEVLCERDGFSRRWPSRVALVALDEAGDDEPGLPPSLADRLAFWVRPGQGAVAGDDGCADAAPPPLPSQPSELEALRAQAARVQVSEALQQALCVSAARLGIVSVRALLFALRVVRASACMNGRSVADDTDALRALQLVLAPRATMLPAAPQEAADDQPDDQADGQADDQADAPADDAQHEPSSGAAEAAQAPPRADNAGVESSQPTSDTPLEDRLVAVAQALLPAELLAALVGRAQRNGATGRRGPVTRSATRGRPAGVRPGAPGGGARLAIVDTLRAAAPWQRLRRDEAAKRTTSRPTASPAARTPVRLQVRASDLRTWRLVHHAATAVVFIVDASGSSALHRLGEAKGAVQLLLADCYVRRDEVAVVAFRGRDAELLLPPTRSLVRARRALAGLPGGGGTPLAAGLLLGARVAAQIQRAGKQPSLVLLTDGRANVGLDGQGGRPAAEADALREARRCRALGLPCLVVDTSSQPAAAARRLADALGGRYEPLPHARADGVARIVAQQLQPAGAARGGR